MSQMFSSTNLKKSITIALNSYFDVEAACRRVRGRIGKQSTEKLYIRRYKGYVSFYEIKDGRQKHVSKKSDEFYKRVREKYLVLLLQVLELIKMQRCGNTIREIDSVIVERNKLTGKLTELIDAYAAAGLDLSKIVLTQKQYKWYFSNYPKKKIDKSSAKLTSDGLYIRSKSERDIGNGLEALTVIYHYEEKKSIYVFPLIKRLEEQLRSSKKLEGKLIGTKDGELYWNVPKELSSMNVHGSIWKSYNEPSGYINIFNDFKIILADGEEIIWEHEGLFADFIYRLNATERIGIMEYMNAVPKRNIITTFERDVDTPEKVEAIIAERILPRLWF